MLPVRSRSRPPTFSDCKTLTRFISAPISRFWFQLCTNAVIAVRLRTWEPSSPRQRPPLSYQTAESCEAGCFQVDILPGRAQYSGYMITQDTRERLELLQGTLDLLILRTLIFGSQHGQGIARAIQETSEKELLVEHGALYPALQRLEERGWISAKWGVSSNNRKARFYSLTAAGRKQLVKETNKWKRLTGAIALILGPEGAKS